MFTVLLLFTLIHQINGFIGTWRLERGTTPSTFFGFGDETLDFKACESSDGTTYFGFYEEEDGNNNLQGFGYQNSGSNYILYRMDILPITEATFSASLTEFTEQNLIQFDFSDATYNAIQISTTIPDNYECVLPYDGTEEPTSIIGTSATGPEPGDENPPENIAVLSATEACYFYEPDSTDPTLWHPGNVENGALIAGNIHIGEYTQTTDTEAYGINVIARYERTQYIEAFCRVSPKNTLDHIANHTSFCKTFSGLTLDNEPYRTCPLCSVDIPAVESDCQQNAEGTEDSSSNMTTISILLIVLSVLYLFM